MFFIDVNLIDSIKQISFYTKRFLLYLPYLQILNKNKPVEILLSVLRHDLDLYPTGNKILYSTLHNLNNLFIDYIVFNNTIEYTQDVELFNYNTNITTKKLKFASLQFKRGLVNININSEYLQLFSLKPVYNYTSIYLKSLCNCKSKILLNFYLFFCRYKADRNIRILFTELLTYITQAKEYYYFPAFRAMMKKRFFNKFNQRTEINIFNFEYTKLNTMEYELLFDIILNPSLPKIYKDEKYELFDE